MARWSVLRGTRGEERRGDGRAAARWGDNHRGASVDLATAGVTDTAAPAMTGRGIRLGEMYVHSCASGVLRDSSSPPRPRHLNCWAARPGGTGAALVAAGGGR